QTGIYRGRTASADSVRPIQSRQGKGTSQALVQFRAGEDRPMESGSNRRRNDDHTGSRLVEYLFPTVVPNSRTGPATLVIRVSRVNQLVVSGSCNLRTPSSAARSLICFL